MASKKKTKGNKRKQKYLIFIIVIIILLFGACQLRKNHIKSHETEARKTEAQTTTTEEVKKNVWEKKDGKSYYYGEDGKVMTGRFVLNDEKKICYANENGEVTRIVDATKPMVAVTYDDGPSQYTDDFVKIFEEHNSAATFFEVGSRIKESKSLQENEKVVANSYSELANHTYGHKNIRNLSVADMNKQVDRCTDQLRAMGEKTDQILFRAPEGAVGETARKNLKAPVILWSVDTLDWKYRDAAKVHKKAVTNIHDGDIILMHSLYESTLNASKKIVPELIDQGYQLVTVSDLAQFRGGLENGRIYFNIKPDENETETTTSTDTEVSSNAVSEGN